MIARTAKMVESRLLLGCLLAAAVGATNAGRRAPFRISSTPSLRPSSGSPDIADGRAMVECVLAMQRSTSHSRRLSYLGDRQDHRGVHAAHDDSVYEALQPRGRWSMEPVTTLPPLRTDGPDGEHIYIKTKLYPYLCF